MLRLRYFLVVPCWLVSLVKHILWWSGLKTEIPFHIARWLIHFFVVRASLHSMTESVRIYLSYFDTLAFHKPMTGLIMHISLLRIKYLLALQWHGRAFRTASLSSVSWTNIYYLVMITLGLVLHSLKNQTDRFEAVSWIYTRTQQVKSQYIH